MTFEIDFPGLSEEIIYRGDLLKEGKFVTWFRQESIVKSCLDKQRVKEAIRKVRDDWDASGERIGLAIDILKELGLGE